MNKRIQYPFNAKCSNCAFFDTSENPDYPDVDDSGLCSCYWAVTYKDSARIPAVAFLEPEEQDFDDCEMFTPHGFFCSACGYGNTKVYALSWDQHNLPVVACAVHCPECWHQEIREASVNLDAFDRRDEIIRK